MEKPMNQAATAAPLAGDNPKTLFNLLVQQGEILDLSHGLDRDMPVYTQHIPYTLTLNRRHGDPHDRERVGGSSFANEVIVMSAHTSTHIDALGHFSRCGMVHGDVPAQSIETRHGLSSLDVTDIGPIWKSAVLFDMARHLGVDTLQPGQEISAAELQACGAADGLQIQPGDLVLVRTGWAQHWRDAQLFNGARGGIPGPGMEGTQWLLDQGAGMVGSDTTAFEVIPMKGEAVHCLLLVDRGIHIIENLNLEVLSQRRTRRFLFVGLPLRMTGATGSPLRPIAVL
jgi:kynurenine formamidase